MAMERWIEGQRALGNQEAVAEGEALRQRFGEIALDSQTTNPVPAVTETPLSPRIEVKANPLEQAVAEYSKVRLHTPEQIRSFQQVLWREIAGVDIVVPVIGESKEEIAEKEEAGKGIILVPEGYALEQDRPRIAQAFKKLLNNDFVPSQWSMVADNPLKNDIIHMGLRWIDMEIDALHLGTNEKQAREAAKKQNADGINHNEYMIASLQSKLTTGKYLDQNRTWIRELSSSRDGRVVVSCFIPAGDVYVDSSVESQVRHVYLCARFSSGVKV